MNKIQLYTYCLFIALITISCNACSPELQTANFTIDGIDTKKYGQDYVEEPKIDEGDKVRTVKIDTKVTFKDKSTPLGAAKVWQWTILGEVQRSTDSICEYTFTQSGIFHVKMLVNEGHEVDKVVYVGFGESTPSSAYEEVSSPVVEEKKEPKPSRDDIKTTGGVGITPPSPPSLSLRVEPMSPSDIVLASGGELKFKIDANGADWSAVKPANTDWLTITQTKEMLILTCAANTTTSPRRAIIDLNKKTSVRVNQSAVAAVPPPPPCPIINEKDFNKSRLISLAQCDGSNFNTNAATLSFTTKSAIKLTKIYVYTNDKGKLKIKVGNKTDDVYVNKGKTAIALDVDELDQVLKCNTNYTISIESEGDVKLCSCTISDKSTEHLTIQSNSSVFYNLSYLHH